MKLSPYKPQLKSQFLGRKDELEVLTRIATVEESSIVIVYGRRRVGKTALIETAYAKRQLLRFEGLEGRSSIEQIQECLRQLSIYANDTSIASLSFKYWRQFFEYLSRFVESGERTLYFEELQWIADYKDDFAGDLKLVWDKTLRHNKKLIIVLCGSAPSFMLNKIVRSSALYNRSQKVLSVKPLPFQVFHTLMGRKRSIVEVAEAVLTLGTIPEYGMAIRDASSCRIGIAEESFRADGFLFLEYDKIFVSHLGNRPWYRGVVEFLSRVRFANRDQIAEHLGTSSGGELSKILIDLEECGFIDRYVPFNLSEGTKTARYAIADPFIRFYNKFIRPVAKRIKEGDFQKQPSAALNSAKFTQWLGLSFEAWCRRHTNLIARQLGFSDVEYHSGSYFERGQKLQQGFQLDLVFQRADRVLSVCEIKYTDEAPGTAVAANFQKRIELLPNKKKFTIQRVLITKTKPSDSIVKKGVFDRVVMADELFKIDE